MVSPYSHGSKFSDSYNDDSFGPHVGDETEWDEARCPICMEHPHNAVMLLCSSHMKGCRPFICDTSYRHSNCLDQLRKSAGALSSQSPPEEHLSKLLCPLCRGAITGWKIVQPARRCMDSKIRRCSLETCSFSGNYRDLRRHARDEHPSKRPSKPSPSRESNWAVMEQQRDLEDAFAYHSDVDYGWGAEEGFLSGDSVFDLEIDVADLEDSLMDAMSFSVSVSFDNMYSSSFYGDPSNPGSSTSGEGRLGGPSSNSSPLLHSQEDDTFPSDPGEDWVHSSDDQRQADLRLVVSRPAHFGENNPRHRYRRENPSRSSHRENPSRGSHRENPSRGSHRENPSRSSHRENLSRGSHRGTNSNILRLSNYREGNSNISRRSDHRENATSSSQSRSRYYRREQHTQPSSRSGQSYYQNRGDHAPSAPRHSPVSSSTRPHSRNYSNEVTPRSGVGRAHSRNIPRSSRRASWRYHESSIRRFRRSSSRRPRSRDNRSSRRYQP